MKKFSIKSISLFFPIRLLIDHIRFNIALIAMWVLLLSIIFGRVGRVYGIHYLFLDPEYIHHVGFLSFFWVGLAMGNFIMAFHITSYILLGHRYSFIGVLEKPFTKFTVNNILIPLIIVAIYYVKIIWFHWGNPTISRWEILVYLLGLFLGLFAMTALVLSYLHFTNKDIFKYLAGSVDKRLRKNTLSRERMMQRYKESREKGVNVNHFLDEKLRVRNCERLHDFPDKESVLQVFDQNHFNSVIFEFGVILVLLLLGVLVEFQWAQIPAAASVLLLFSMITMIIGAVSYWFRGWGLPLVLAIFIVLNTLSRAGIFNGNHAALGIDYQKKPVTYSLARLDSLSSPENYEEDKVALLYILDQWKKKQPISVDGSKPKLVLMCVSGGGQRAALWTLAAIQHIDQSTESELMQRTFSITGASGGMIGAAYYRSLYLRHLKDPRMRLSDSLWVQNIGKDNLNALVFSLISNDIFVDVKKVIHGDMTYYADRGILFEHNLNRNLGGIFDQKISQFRELERQSRIPMMIMSPVVGNDGRKLFLSASPINYMTVVPPEMKLTGQSKIRGVDFQRLFAAHRADSLTMLSALRMSASFPYITPTVRLPSDPPLEVMDAGIADNFGITDAVHLSYVAKDWINENTSGVVLLVIRDTQKNEPIEPIANPTLIHRFTYPIASVYNNLSNMQDVKNDQIIEYSSSWLQVPVETVTFEYDAITFAEEQELKLLAQNKLNSKEVLRASLSWHLTAQEKQSILNNLERKDNRSALKRLKNILD